jgi:FkbH-like protein
MNPDNQATTNVLRICLAANFTAEPIEDYLAFWMSEIQVESQIAVAPYNQVFQQLFEGGLLYSNVGGVNLVALDIEAWLVSGPIHDAQTQLERTIADLGAALRVAGTHGAGGALLLFPTEAYSNQAEERPAALAAAKAAIFSECEGIPGWNALDLTDSVSQYSISKVRDPFTAALGDIPFTEETYAAAATVVARWIRTTRSKPSKVIVLDCDNTLWQGVYGEGTMVVSAPYRYLQEFMLRQLEDGMLLLLASKNNEEDVMGALESEDCLLRPEHFAAWQINWSPKSENLKLLSDELGLALNSFIFVDDSAYECMEVRNSCPDVKTIQLPHNPEAIPAFLQHLWVFDRSASTAEDQARASMYQAERQRNELSKRALTPEEFLTSLRIEIQLAPVTESELPRVVQLMQRTTQFNLTGVLHTEQSLISTLVEGSHQCWTVRVQDIFGDYGLVGVILFGTTHEALNVEAFLLSCRALGRGVEDRMVEKLKECAREQGVDRIAVPFVPTARNRPALEFLQRLCGVPADSRDPFECTLSGSSSSSEWRRVAAASSNQNQLKPELTKRQRLTSEADTLVQIAAQMQSAASVITAVRRDRRVRPVNAGPFIEPKTSVEATLAKIWSENLSIEPIGISDNYFYLGGTSLIAVRILSRVLAEFGVKLGLSSMLQMPTIAGLAEEIVNATSVTSSH